MKAKRLAVILSASLGVVAGALLSSAAYAQLSAADVAKLGTTLTPMGADKAGNAAGTIQIGRAHV